jgi:serine phosphatase RsbU (regulator of sigma subunit)
VLGIVPGASFHEDSVVLHPKDIVVCFSDGLSEAENAAGERFRCRKDSESGSRPTKAGPRGRICNALPGGGQQVRRFNSAR